MSPSGAIWDGDRMLRVLFCLWLVGVVLHGPIVLTADNFFVKEYGPLAGFARFGSSYRHELLWL